MKTALIITGGIITAILAGFAAGYIVARKRGKTHEEAIKGLKEWVKSLPQEAQDLLRRKAKDVPGGERLVEEILDNESKASA